MPDEAEGGREWIVEPPEPGEVSLHMALGEGVELTDEQEAALGQLLRTLETRDPEVTGHAALDASCKPLKCGGVDCKDLDCSPLSASLTGNVAQPWSIMGSFSPRLR